MMIARNRSHQPNSASELSSDQRTSLERPRKKGTPLERFFCIVIVLFVLTVQYAMFAALISESEESDQIRRRANGSTSVVVNSKDYGRCAIIFWGLPRAFDTLVLPSIVKNIIIPNAKYNCDYYAHYYHLTEEAAGRSGEGGRIDPQAILALKKAVEEHAVDPDNLPRVEFAYDTDEMFWTRYNDLIEKIRTEKDSDGKYYYYPWKARTYKHPTTTDNIIKMWHTIQSGWELMAGKGISYKQVGMFRSDVLYMTPVDVFENPNDLTPQKTATERKMQTHDTITTPAVIPNFGNHPVSDRFIYGPFEAVKIWATERFNKLDKHAAWIHEHDPGWAMHSERFMDYSIFPAIREKTGVDIVPHPTLCFLRARADGSVWISDCEGPPSVSDPRIMQNLGGNTRKLQGFVEKVIGHRCGKVTKPRINVKSLDCSIAQ